jgi:hypothetical protein
MSISPNTLEPLFGPSLDQILQEMEEVFPSVTPSPDNDLRQIMYKSGQRSVVEWLINRLDKN